jgi:hypothetical protein
MDARCLFSAEFYGVADEVLEELTDLGGVRDDFRERIMGHQGPLRVERPGEILQRYLQNGGSVDHLKWPGVGTDPGTFQKIQENIPAAIDMRIRPFPDFNDLPPNS